MFYSFSNIDLNFKKLKLHFELYPIGYNSVGAVDKSFSLLELRDGIPHPVDKFSWPERDFFEFRGEVSWEKCQVPRKEDTEVNETSSLLLRNLES